MTTVTNFRRGVMCTGARSSGDLPEVENLSCFGGGAGKLVVVPLPGFRLLAEPTEAGPVAIAPAVRDSDGLEVTVRWVIAKLDRAQLRRVRDEAAALDDILARTNNPFVLPLLDHDRDLSGRPFLVTPRRGRSLSDELAARGPLPVPAAVDAVLDAATGLELLHRGGAVHQAVGPAALLRQPTGRVVLDCPPLPVLAELAAETTEGTGHEPPEVLAGGDWTPAGEIYALASTLWMLLTGRAPFAGSRAERVLFAGQGSAGRLPPDAAELTAALLSALAADPGARPGSVPAFARRLKDRGPDPVPAEPVATDTRATLVPGPVRTLGGEYELLSPIGAGSMGTVWRARRVADHAPVAVKLLHRELVSDPDTLIRLVREASALQHLDHPHLVRVRDLHIAKGRGEAAVIMDLVDGLDLRRLLDDGGLGAAEAMRLLSEVASGLAAVHENGVVHRDLKPANVLVREQDGRRRALLTDFGLAKPIGNAAVTQVGYVPGTPAYLAPELIDGAAPAAASDVYALGVTAYEVLAGRRPFTAGSTQEVLLQHQREQPARPPDLSDALWDFLLSCLAKNPRHRPGAAQAADVLADLASELLLSGPERTVPGSDTETTMVIGAVAAPADSSGPTAPALRPVDPYAVPAATAPPTENSPVRLTPRPEPVVSRRIPWRRLLVAGAAVLLLAATGTTVGVLAGRHRSTPDPPAPTQPGLSLRVDVTYVDGRVTVTWPTDSAAVPGASSYAVFRNGQPAEQLPLNSFSYQDFAPAPPGCYRVVVLVPDPPSGPAPPATCVTIPTSTTR